VALVEVVEVLPAGDEEGLQAPFTAFADLLQLGLHLGDLLGDLAPLRGCFHQGLLLLPGGPLLVSTLVLGVPAQVGDDHVVQGADGFAEGHALAQLAGEERGLAQGVGRERHPRAGGAVADVAVALVRVVKLHGAPPPDAPAGARPPRGKRPESASGSRWPAPCPRWPPWPTAGRAPRPPRPRCPRRPVRPSPGS